MVAVDHTGAAIRLAPRDAANIYAESAKSPANTVHYYVFDTTNHRAMSEAQTVEWMRSRLGHFETATRRLQRLPGDVGYPVWVADTGFDITRHIRVTPAANPGWEPVKVALRELLTSRMDLSRPPWDMRVITGVTGIDPQCRECTVVVLRLHHAVGDGIEVAAIARRLFDSPPSSPPQTDAARYNRWRDTAMSGCALPVTTLRFLYTLARVAVVWRRTQSTTTGDGHVLAQNAWPKTMFNQKLTGVLRIGIVDLPLDEAMAVKSRFPGATLNDLMLATVSGALRSLLREADQTQNESLGAIVPMSMRNFSDESSANRFVLMTIPLHNDLPDPVARLTAICRATQAAKRQSARPATLSLAKLARSSPAPITRIAGVRAARRQVPLGAPPANTLISNVPGGPARGRFGDAPAVNAAGVLTLAEGQGLSHFITTVGNRLTITFTADANALPNSAAYEHAIHTAYTEIASASRCDSGSTLVAPDHCPETPRRSGSPSHGDPDSLSEVVERLTE